MARTEAFSVHYSCVPVDVVLTYWLQMRVPARDKADFARRGIGAPALYLPRDCFRLVVIVRGNAWKVNNWLKTVCDPKLYGCEDKGRPASIYYESQPVRFSVCRFFFVPSISA